MDTMGNLDMLQKMIRENQMLFFMALSHLFDNGAKHFTEDAVQKALAALDDPERKAGGSAFLAPAFEKAVIDVSYELSKMPLMDILLAVKLYADIYHPGSEVQDEKEAE